MRYFEGSTTPVDVAATKYDSFVFRLTGAKYRCQPKSGRAIVLQALVSDGMTMAELCRKAAQEGVEIEGVGRRYFPAGFVCGSALKHLVSPTRIFSLEHPEGLTVDEVSRTRTRAADPESVAKAQARRSEVEARKTARAEAKAAKEQARKAAKEQRARDLEERKAAKAAEREQRKTEREAARLARQEQKRANDEAKAAAAAAQDTGSQADAPVVARKGKRGRKASGGAAPEAAAA